jgi:lipoate-protein ligase A
MESYKRICGAIIRGLDNIGIDSIYFPINDILTNHKKISGNAQTRKSKTVLQHGTILMDVDVEKMFSILKVPNEKIKDKLIKDVRERVTSIKHVLESKISFKELADSMKRGFEEEFNVNLVKGDLTQEELDLAKNFEKECFSAEEWNYRR